MDKSVYLPLSSGCLHSYAIQNELIRDSYSFKPYKFLKRPIEETLDSYDNPAIAGFSCSMWNVRYSLKLAQQLKQKYPDCLIVFGGASTPFDAGSFLKENSFIDVTVRGEGEATFQQILLRYLNKDSFDDIPFISYRRGDEVVKTPDGHLPPLDYPCPYVSGLFDNLLTKTDDLNYQIIIETNRGCPFGCAFCFWGQGTLKEGKKFRFFELERMEHLAEWCGKNQIAYIFCADSNFGSFERDIDIANYFIKAKQKYSYPEKFRVCYAKNSEDKVYRVGKLLHDYDMEKSITLSRQSNDDTALDNVNRKNIKLSVFNKLSSMYAFEGIPVYTEFIVGLPGETYESFVAGVEKIIDQSFANQIFIYLCQLFPNTKMDDPLYREKFKIKSIEVPFTPLHGSIYDVIDNCEKEAVIVETMSLSSKEWQKTMVFAWLFQMFLSLKIAFYIFLYLQDKHLIYSTSIINYIIDNSETGPVHETVQYLQQVTEDVINGKTYGCVVEGAVPVYWSPDEGALLINSGRWAEFYTDFSSYIIDYCNKNNINLNVDEFKEIITYQLIKAPCVGAHLSYFEFNYNIPSYFANRFKNRIGLEQKTESMELDSTIINSMYELSKKLLVGRKSNRILFKEKKIGS